ncbi:MAG: hypothetical protein AVDCRST_MAG49-3885, partial [uncultured Thermomicrobiales bacterium]
CPPRRAATAATAANRRTSTSRRVRFSWRLAPSTARHPLRRRRATIRGGPDARPA